ncbi:MAG: Lipoprotein NosD family containing CASH domain [Candidatus Methanohalarchaeum thermophilum]|uniref:Lipoprotein NosD family containing CASH domain n=1 Tax=Methanohalarchaeum thermophilum TaxID=1903181 RepID=A0A1Q6DSL4_METT1|nr:MAG: Lipoprotein NosD family containing CASH domain [Candidatus Methanohalarchaeum thermophilum]
MNDSRKRLIAIVSSIALVISVFSLITLAPAQAQDAGADIPQYSTDYTASSADWVVGNASQANASGSDNVVNSIYNATTNSSFSSDSVIFVNSTYNDSYEQFPIPVDVDNVTIVSMEGPSGTVIDVSEKNNAFLVSGSNAIIKGFNIKNVGADAILAENSSNNLTVTYNEIFNVTNGFGGIQVKSDSVLIKYNVIENCTYGIGQTSADPNKETNGTEIHHNIIRSTIQGVSGWRAHNMTVSHNEIYVSGADNQYDKDSFSVIRGIDVSKDNVTIENNIIETQAPESGESATDIKVGKAAAVDLNVHYNQLIGEEYGINVVTGYTDTVNATLNYWGASDGPGGVGCGSGSNVSENVSYNPFFKNSEMTVLGSCVAPGVEVELENPGKADTLNISIIPAAADASSNNVYRFGKVDVQVSGTNATITINYDDSDVAGLDEDDLVPQYFDGDEWVECSDYTVNTSANYVEITVNSETTPAVPLTGTAFSVASYDLSVSPDTVIYNDEGVELTGTLTEGGDLLQTQVNYSVYTPEGQQVGYGTTNDGEFTHTQDFVYNDSENTPYEANYTVYVNTNEDPTQSNWEAKFIIQQELNFSWNEADDQPFKYDSTQGFSGKLLDAKGNVIEDYNVTLLRGDKTVEYDNFQDGFFGFTTIINDHANWTLGVTDNTSYVYKYYDVKTEPKEDLNIEFDTENTVARLAEGDYNITITNRTNDKYGLINVTGIQWKQAPDSDDIVGGTLVANGSDSDTGDATWLLFNDSNNNGMVNFTAKPNSTGDIVVDAMYEDPEVETPSTWDASSEYYDRLGTLDPAAKIVAPEDANVMYNKTWDAGIASVDYSNLSTFMDSYGEFVEVTENQTIEVLPINDTDKERLQTEDNRFGEQFKGQSVYLFEFGLRWGEDGDLIGPQQQNGTIEVSVTGAGVAGPDGEVTYNVSELDDLYDNQGGNEYLVPFVPMQDDDYVTAEIKINNSGEIITKTIKKEVTGLTADVLIDGEEQDVITWGTEAEMNAQITKEDNYVNNGFVYLMAYNTSSDSYTKFEVTDARSDFVNDGKYSFNLTDQLWDNISANHDMWFIGYWYEDADNDDQFKKDEVSLAVYKNYTIEPADVYDISVEPEAVTAGIQQENLTMTISDDEGPVTDLVANSSYYTVEVDGEAVTDLEEINASQGKYAIEEVDGENPVFSEEGSHNVTVTTSDNTKTGTGTFNAILPTVEYEITVFDSEGDVYDTFTCMDNFTATAGTNKTYNVSVTAYDINDDPINGSTIADHAYILLGSMDKANFTKLNDSHVNNSDIKLELDVNGSANFTFTPQEPVEVVWKVGEYSDIESNNDSMAVVEEPALVADNPKATIRDAAGGTIPMDELNETIVDLPLGVQSEIMVILQPADQRDADFGSKQVEVLGPVSETAVMSLSEQEDVNDVEGFNGTAQVARLTLTPSGVGEKILNVTISGLGSVENIDVVQSAINLKVNVVSTQLPVVLEVTDEFGNPVADARVDIDGVEAITGSEGKIQLTEDKLSAGETYTASAKKAGYAPGEATFTVEEPEKETLSIDGSSSITIEETATYTLTDEDGEPITGVTVTAGDKTATTNSDGEVQFTYTEAGDVTVTAEKEGYKQATMTTTVEKQTETKDLNLTVETAEGDRKVDNAITFKVTADGEPVEDATISAGEQTATTGSDGTASLTFDNPDDYTVTATKEDETTETTITTYNSDSTTITVQKTPGFTTIAALTGVLAAALILYRKRNIQ